MTKLKVLKTNSFLNSKTNAIYCKLWAVLEIDGKEVSLDTFNGINLVHALDETLKPNKAYMDNIIDKNGIQRTVWKIDSQQYDEYQKSKEGE